VFPIVEDNYRIIRSQLCNDNKMWLRYVDIQKTAYRKHYEVISNQLLWFLQHYLYNFIPDGTFVTDRIQDAWINGFCVANQAIANAVSQAIDRDSNSDISVVMLHDYHLYLAPALIRKLQPSSIITQFIHIPWPDARWWQLLPSNITYEIYSSLVCGNDIIGFQTPLDASNFTEGVRSVLTKAAVNFEEGVISSQESSYPYPCLSYLYFCGRGKTLSTKCSR
jgi:trehalose 6-phosphate synthase